jgi:hypothetical protein
MFRETATTTRLPAADEERGEGKQRVEPFEPRNHLTQRLQAERAQEHEALHAARVLDGEPDGDVGPQGAAGQVHRADVQQVHECPNERDPVVQGAAAGRRFRPAESRQIRDDDAHLAAESIRHLEERDRRAEETGEHQHYREVRIRRRIEVVDARPVDLGPPPKRPRKRP